MPRTATAEPKAEKAELVNPVDQKPGFVKDNERKIMDTLAELGGRGVRDEDVLFHGTKFVLPAKVSLKEACDFLVGRLLQEEHKTAYTRTFNYRIWDGAHATQAALRKAFGVMGAKSIFTIFGERPPELRTINTGVESTEQVPWGALTLPILPESTIYLVGDDDDPELGTLFKLYVEAPRKFRHEVEGIFKLVEDELENNSIYRGQAIDGKSMPNFLDLRGIDPTQVIYSDDVVDQLEASIWSLLRHTPTMREMGLPLKRAVLLEGPYGTGKTLAAYLTAQIAVNNGWTFIMCRPGKDDLDEVMQTARLYQPAVVHFEDVDVLANNGEPDAVARLLDLFDGITAKGTELMVVLTTNHADKIHKGMVRPGRLDAVIHIGSLDRNGIERMIDAVVPKKLLDGKLDVDKVAFAMQGFLPAFVKEAIDRAMRYAIARTNGRPDRLTTDDFVAAAEGLRPQLELMAGAGEGELRDPLSVQFRNIVEGVVHNTKVDGLEAELVPSNGRRS